MIDSSLTRWSILTCNFENSNERSNKQTNSKEREKKQRINTQKIDIDRINKQEKKMKFVSKKQ
jgi:hypothetical protein